MPRKYHRPPSATKRRKTRKTSIPYDLPRESDAEEEVVGEEMLDEDAPLLAVDISPDIPEEEDAGPLKVTRGGRGQAQERHVNRDYSYVRAEVIRIVALVAFLMIALAITAVFR